jgi:hypothetical protein
MHGGGGDGRSDGGDGRTGGDGESEGGTVAAAMGGAAAVDNLGGWDRVEGMPARALPVGITLIPRRREGWRHTYKMRAQPATSENSMAPWGRAPCNTTTAPWGRAP